MIQAFLLFLNNFFSIKVMGIQLIAYLLVFTVIYFVFKIINSMK